jgi:hypothetical protein
MVVGVSENLNPGLVRFADDFDPDRDSDRFHELLARGFLPELRLLFARESRPEKLF